MVAPVKLGASGVLTVAAIAGGAFIGWKLYRLAKGAAGAAADVAVHAVTKDLNPASDDNIVNRAVIATGRAVTGDSNWTLGGWVFDVLNPHAFDNKPTPLPKREIDMGRGNGWDAPIDDETARLLARYPVSTSADAIYGGYQELPGYGGPTPDSPL